MYCYLLHANNGSTYIGATTDVDRRLRQHNGELVGGASATAIQVGKGHVWKRVCYLTGIPEWRSTLQIEWRWKQLGRTRFSHIKHPIQRRLHSLRYLLSLEKPTEKAIPYEAYPDGAPQIVWEDNIWRTWYETLGVN